MPVVDLSGVADFQGVPAGEYVATLSGIKMKKTAKNDDMAVLEYTVSDEDQEQYNGQKIFQNHVLTPESYWKLKQTMVAFDADPDLFAAPFDVEAEIKEMFGRKAIVVVKETGNEKYPYSTDRCRQLDL